MPSEIYKFFIGGPGSDIANYLGLFFTIIGFIITIAAVKKSQKASEEAKKEVIKVREDIKKIDAVNDLSTAIAMIEEIRTLQRDSRWVYLPDRFSALKKLLISIKKTYPDLTDSQKAIIQGTLQHITDIDHKIESSVRNKTEPTNIPKINMLLSEQKDDVYEMLVELRSTIGVREND